MESKVFNFGYEDTDKSIEVGFYGLIFEVNNIEDATKYEKLDDEEQNKIEEVIERIIGKGSIEKINNKRKEDGYKPLTKEIELNMLGCIFEAYTKGQAESVLGKVKDSIDGINKEIRDFNGIDFNKYNYNKRKNYNRSRKGYRRY